MPLQPETITLLKPVRVADAGGGKTETFTSVGAFSASQNFYSKQSLERLEQSTHSGDGPGILTKTLKLWTFYPPFPATILRDYRIQDASGVKWRVLFIRSYSRTMQVDTELVA